MGKADAKMQPAIKAYETRKGMIDVDKNKNYTALDSKLTKRLTSTKCGMI